MKKITFVGYRHINNKGSFIGQAFIKGLVINSTAVYLALEMNVSFISILQLVVVGLITLSVFMAVV